jgi:DNA-binding NarL/FixJ family response regulator
MNILLIDDHPLFRAGIADVVRELSTATHCAEVSNCEGAVRLIKGGAEFDLILLDLNLPGMDGMTGITILRDALPATPIVILSATENAAKIRQAIGTGAKGYIPKSSGRDLILGALRLVLSGGVYLPLNLIQMPGGEGHAGPDTGLAAGPDAACAGLTPRQLDVLRLLARGKSNKEIAYTLGLAENTVRVHVAAILKYLDVKNRTEAGYAATRRGLTGMLD